MTFATPTWFWGLAAVPVLVWLFVRAERLRVLALAELVAPRLQALLVRGAAPWFRRTVALFGIAALGATALALARPQRGYVEETIPSVGRDVLLGIDTSRSMLAPDLPPSRLVRAKLAAEDLIRALPGDRVGLIAFAGSSFLQAPLTADHEAVLDSLRELDAGIIPRGGTNIGSAIRTAMEAFSKAGEGGRALVLFTDGEELDADGASAAREAAAKGIRLFLVGVGTPAGSVIPLPGGGYVKDPSGNVVRSRLDEARLREIAGAASAEWFVLGTGAPPAERISDSIRSLTATEAAGRSQRTPLEQFQWPLGIALVLLGVSLLLPEARNGRGIAKRTGGSAPAASVVVLALLLLPARGRAAQVDPHRAYAEGDFAAAFEQFGARARSGDPRQNFNAGTAAYRLEQWDAAERAFSEALASGNDPLRAAAAYNLGNTLVRRGATRKEITKARGDYEDAIRSYDHAIELDPGSAAAKKNRAAAEEALKQLKEAEPPPPSPDKKQKPDENQKQEKQEQKDPKQDGSGNSSDESQSEPNKEEGDPQASNKPGDEKPGQGDRKGSEEKSQGGSEQEENAADPQPGRPGDEQEPGPGDDTGKQAEPGSSGNDPAEGERKPGGEPVQPDRERSGAVSGSEPARAGEDPEKSSQTAQAIEEAQAADEGRMTEAQAAALLESMRDRDVRVPLIERRRAGPVSKDW